MLAAAAVRFLKGFGYSALFEAFPQGGSKTCDIAAAGTPHSGLWLGGYGGLVGRLLDSRIHGGNCRGMRRAAGARG
jgi:hypothetical protein